MGTGPGIRDAIASVLVSFAAIMLHDEASPNTGLQPPMFICFHTHESWGGLSRLGSALLVPGLCSGMLHVFLHFPGQAAVWDTSFLW